MKSGVAPYIPKDTLERVLAAQSGINATRDRAILYLSHYLGLRAKELAALRVGDVLDGNGHIRETIRLLASMTKGKKFREVFLVNADARRGLHAHLLQRSRHSDAPLFLSQRGCRFSANTMQRLLRIVYSKANVKASSHSGRRSFATRLIEAGADIYSVQCMLGHASIATTQRYFTSSPERLKKFASLLG